MKRLILIPLLVVIITALVLGGCGEPTEPTTPTEPTKPVTPTTPPKHDIVNLTLLGAALGSDAHNFCQALADIVNKNHPWIRISVVETQGAQDNILQMAELTPDKQALHIANGVDSVMRLATFGKGPFGEKGAITDWRALFSLYAADPHFMTLDPNIKGPEDMIGKKIGMVPVGHGLSKDAAFILNDCWGIGDKVEIINMPLEMQKDALLDGTVDITVSGGMWVSDTEIKVSPFNEQILAARENVYMIGITKEAWEAGIAKVPDAAHQWAPVKANALRPGYPSEDTGCIRLGMTWFTWKNMDEETAYELTKVTGENTDKFKEYFAAGSATNPSIFVKNAWKEEMYHPGALKALKEMGLTPEGHLAP